MVKLFFISEDFSLLLKNNQHKLQKTADDSAVFFSIQILQESCVQHPSAYSLQRYPASHYELN